MSNHTHIVLLNLLLCFHLEERAELVEPNEKILCNRPWKTLFCPIKTLQVAQDPLFANLYVNAIALDGLGNHRPTLNCEAPSNDEEFYNTTMRRM